MKRLIAQLVDVVFAPATLISACILKFIRRLGTEKTPISRFIFKRVGLLPVRSFYHEPFFQPLRSCRHSEGIARELPGVDLNESGQLDLLDRFHFAEEIRAVGGGDNEYGFVMRNPSYGPGDADYLYNMVRHFKPSRIVEVGSGNSTRMLLSAIRKNRIENEAYDCEVTCIEPFMSPYLEDFGVNVVRECVENCDPAVFRELGANDILFIDSSHVIRSGSDVLFLFQQVLPSLGRGVIVHVHDVFTPYNYPDSWRDVHMHLWNEQYLLEAFLAGNSSFRVLGALNYLYQRHGEPMAEKCPGLSMIAGRRPGSFWMQRV